MQKIDAMKLTAVYRRVPDGYIALVEELPGSNTQGETLDEARTNLREAESLVLPDNLYAPIHCGPPAGREFE